MANSEQLPQKIIVTADFSVYDQKAVDIAAKYAEALSAQLLVVHVVEPLSAYFGNMFFGMTPRRREERQQRLEAIRPVNSSVDVQHVMLRADDDALSVNREIAEEIVAYAQQEAVGLIVMSARGRSSVRDVILGGVTEHVMISSPCPVMVIQDSAPTTK